MESPRPVPFPISFVVKKGSKRRDIVVESIPQPVSLTLSRMKSPGRASFVSIACSGVIVTCSTSMKRVPPLGMPFKKLVEQLDKNNHLESVHEQLLTEKVIDLLVQNAKIEDVQPEPAKA